MSAAAAGISDESIKSFYSNTTAEPAPAAPEAPAPDAPPAVPHGGPLMGNPPAAPATPKAADPKPADAPAPKVEDPKAEPKAEDPPKEGEPKAEGEPLEFEVTLPEGAEVNPEALESFKGTFTSLAKEVGLNAEAASKLASGLAAWEVERGKAQAEADEKAVNQLQEKWASQIREKYGDGFQDSYGRVDQAITRFGGQAFRDMVTSLGIGNQPVLWDLLDAVGKAIQEAKPGGGPEAGNGASTGQPSTFEQKVERWAKG